MRGFYHDPCSLFLSVGAGRPHVAVPHAPVGVAKRPCHCATDITSTHAPPTPAALRVPTLCGPHHHAALRCLCPSACPPPTSACSSTTAERYDARTPPSGQQLHPFLPQPDLCVARL